MFQSNALKFQGRHSAFHQPSSHSTRRRKRRTLLDPEQSGAPNFFMPPINFLPFSVISLRLSDWKAKSDTLKEHL
jgi:hypothetical protein